MELIIWNKGKYIKALEHYQQVLELSLSYLPSKHAGLIPLYDGIGVYYFKQGDYLNAVQNYEKAAKFTLDEQGNILTKKHT